MCRLCSSRTGHLRTGTPSMLSLAGGQLAARLAALSRWLVRHCCSAGRSHAHHGRSQSSGSGKPQRPLWDSLQDSLEDSLRDSLRDWLSSTLHQPWGSTMAEGAGWATEAHRACSRALVNENPSAVLAREALQEVRGAGGVAVKASADPHRIPPLPSAPPDALLNLDSAACERTCQIKQPNTRMHGARETLTAWGLSARLGPPIPHPVLVPVPVPVPIPSQTADFAWVEYPHGCADLMGSQTKMAQTMMAHTTMAQTTMTKTCGGWGDQFPNMAIDCQVWIHSWLLHFPMLCRGSSDLVPRHKRRSGTSPPLTPYLPCHVAPLIAPPSLAQPNRFTKHLKGQWDRG